MIPTIQTRDIKITDDISITMVYVPGGRFFMGSEDEEALDWEKPIHEVILSPFWIGETPVTQAQWEAVMGSNPSFFQGADRPVEQVSWNDTQAFIEKLNQRTGESFELPNEVQWEFAARGGHTSSYRYSGSNKLHEVGWFYGNSHRETKPVKLKAPNGLGLFDMSGNVDEWCSTMFLENSSVTSRNSRFKKIQINSVDGWILGGNFINDLWECKLSNRTGFPRGSGGDFLGLRLALSNVD